MPPFIRFNICGAAEATLKDSERNESNIDRRKFLSATGSGLLAAAAMPGIASAASREAGASWPGFGGTSAGSRDSNAARGQDSGAKKKIPIGVFDPVYDNLSLEQMLETMSALGMEAV